MNAPLLSVERLTKHFPVRRGLLRRVTGAELAGGLVVPYFDEPVDIRLDVESNGAFTCTWLCFVG